LQQQQKKKLQVRPILSIFHIAKVKMQLKTQNRNFHQIFSYVQQILAYRTKLRAFWFGKLRQGTVLHTQNFEIRAT
jgi:hypothetical protein